MQAGKGKAGEVVKGSKADLDRRSVGLPIGWRALWDIAQKRLTWTGVLFYTLSH